MVRRMLYISWTCFEAPGIKNIFYLYVHCDILDKTSLRDSDGDLESQSTEKIQASSAKSFAFKINPSGKSCFAFEVNSSGKL